MTKARDLANLISGGFTEADIPNLSASKITSGTFADARIAASNVSQHASSFDDNKIVNDISTLGLRVHTQENLNASNTNSASFDVFQDDSKITSLTNVTRTSEEFISSIVPEVERLYNTSSEPTYTGTYATSGGSSYWDGGSKMRNNASNAESGVWRTASAGSGTIKIDFSSSVSVDKLIWGFSRNAGVVRGMTVTGSNDDSSYSNIDWSNSTTSSLYQDGSSNSLSSFNSSGRLNFDGGLSSSSHNNRFSQTGFSAFTYRYILFNVDSHDFHDANAHITEFRAFKSASANATGSFEGATITAAASTSSMGAVITYQDNAGTNTLNTDIILKLSANNGSNYSTATLTALPDFATGIKMAKVNDLSVTAGTQLKYKIEFANQASGSKEARIRGVSLQY
jgi:hypothetical protein